MTPCSSSIIVFILMLCATGSLGLLRLEVLCLRLPGPLPGSALPPPEQLRGSGGEDRRIVEVLFVKGPQIPQRVAITGTAVTLSDGVLASRGKGSCAGARGWNSQHGARSSALTMPAIVRLGEEGRTRAQERALCCAQVPFPGVSGLE